MKKRHEPLTGRNDGIRELASRIEAELSGGSRKTLRQLLARLAVVEDDCEEEVEEGYDSNDLDDLDEAFTRGLSWDSRERRRRRRLNSTSLDLTGGAGNKGDRRHYSRQKVASTRGTGGDRLARPGGRGGSSKRSSRRWSVAGWPGDAAMRAEVRSSN